MKKALNAMINATAPLKRQPSGLRLSDFGTNWKTVSRRIMEKHAAIADAFYSDAGARLQIIDAEIAEEIMLDFAAKAVPVLPIHDSFVIERQYEAELRQVMLKAFRKRFGVEVGIKRVEGASVPDWNIGRDARPEEGYEKRLRAFHGG